MILSVEFFLALGFCSHCYILYPICHEEAHCPTFVESNSLQNRLGKLLHIEVGNCFHKYFMYALHETLFPIFPVPNDELMEICLTPPE